MGCPSWFPDGKRLVFARDYMLHVTSLVGASTRITDPRDGTLYRPAVSPDGSWIACDGSLEAARTQGKGSSSCGPTDRVQKIDDISARAPAGI